MNQNAIAAPHLIDVAHGVLHAHELGAVDLHLRLDDVGGLRDDGGETAGEHAAAEVSQRLR